jgi:hypothetical protein
VDVASGGTATDKAKEHEAEAEAKSQGHEADGEAKMREQKAAATSKAQEQKAEAVTKTKEGQAEAETKTGKRAGVTPAPTTFRTTYHFQPQLKTTVAVLTSATPVFPVFKFPP